MTDQTYRVHPGDTLSRIARLFRSTVARLAAANGIGDPDRIRAGAVLRIPAAPAGSAPLGQLSRQYEVGSLGPGAVSGGNGDRGGVSYGSYQLAAKLGRPAEFLAAEGGPWAARFAGLAPGSDAFSAQWRRCAASDPAAFEAAQHGFIERTHYAVQAALLARQAGLDLARHSRALREVVWSTAVQHGPSTSIVLAALRAPPAGGGDAALIRAIYAERGRRRDDGALVHFGGNSRAVQEAVARRFVSECRDALALLAGER